MVIICPPTGLFTGGLKCTVVQYVLVEATPMRPFPDAHFPTAHGLVIGVSDEPSDPRSPFLVARVRTDDGGATWMAYGTEYNLSAVEAHDYYTERLGRSRIQWLERVTEPTDG